MSTGSSGSAMLMMATPLMLGHGSTSHGPICLDGSSYRPDREWELQQTRLRKEREALIRAGKRYVADLERLLMPLVLPDRLHLCETHVESHEGDGQLSTSSYGFKIAGNANADPLLVGYRYGSRLKNKIHHISLCLGPNWYGSSSGPFLKASRDGKKCFTIKYRSEYPDGNGKCVRVVNTTASKLGTAFTMVVPDLADNTPTLQTFEWRLRPELHQRDQETEFGIMLMLISTAQPPQVVARMDWGQRNPHRVLTGDFDINFMGAGTAYGGTWKILAFVIGILVFY